MQILIDFEASPSIDGGISLLCIGELWCLPIGELLPFADLVLEENGIDFLEAHVCDAVLLDELLQLDEAGRMTLANTGNLVEVVTGGEPHLDAGPVFEV